jgi:hypothetical protein
VSEDGRVVRDKDRTIAQLLAALHIAVAEEEAAARAAPPFGDFNRFFSYQDEIRNQRIIPYKYAATSRAWSNLNAPVVRRMNARTVDPRAAS